MKQWLLYGTGHCDPSPKQRVGRPFGTCRTFFLQGQVRYDFGTTQLIRALLRTHK